MYNYTAKKIFNKRSSIYELFIHQSYFQMIKIEYFVLGVRIGTIIFMYFIIVTYCFIEIGYHKN
jgi:hypothetical protein